MLVYVLVFTALTIASRVMEEWQRAFLLVCWAVLIGHTATALLKARRWIETDGEVIRASNLFSGKITTWQCRDLLTVTELKRHPLTYLPPFLAKRFGYTIRFKDGSKLVLTYSEFPMLTPFLAALGDNAEGSVPLNGRSHPA
jgi:hypothetical protein